MKKWGVCRKALYMMLNHKTVHNFVTNFIHGSQRTIKMRVSQILIIAVKVIAKPI